MGKLFCTIRFWKCLEGQLNLVLFSGNAIRLCKENHMADELWNIGLVASNRDQIDCARYFEDIDNLEKAVILYHRAGMLHKALDLAFKSNQYDILQQIATDLDADSDPALVQKCADYFVNNEQFDKAVDLLAVGKKVLVDLSSLFGSC